MNRRDLIFAVCWLGVLVCSAPADDAVVSPNGGCVDYGKAIKQLEAVVQEELDRGIISGVSIALVDGQQTVLADGFGFADRETQRPATATTVYRVGSISKLFTAVAAMQLVEQSKLDLDAPVTDYLPEFRIVSPFPAAGPVTLRQFLCHRSGMVRESPVGGYLDGSQPTVAETIASLEACALVNPPNSKTRYSNVGPTIVGQAVAAAGGLDFEAYQQQHVLGPLGMEHSAWRMNDRLREQYAASYMRIANGHGGFVHRRSPEFELGTLPAGNLYSTANDIAQFAKMVLAKGEVGSQRILQAETLATMATPQLTGDSSGFGLGFYVGTFAGHGTVQHSGAVYGFSSSLVILPEQEIAVIVFVNEDIAMGPVRRLSDAALSLMLETKFAEPPAAAPAAIGLTEEQQQAMTGEYESESYWAEITLDDGRLRADISGQPLDLTAIEPLTCEASGRFAHRSAFQFQQDEQGRITGFTGLGQRFERVDAAREQAIPHGWQRFLGSYGPDFIPLVVSVRHGHLYAMTENMVDYRLTPVNQFVFRMPEGLYADEHLMFHVNNRGKVASANLANMSLPRR